MRPVFKIIIAYEVFFFLFWQILYNSNSEIENWFQAKILTAIYTFLSNPIRIPPMPANKSINSNFLLLMNHFLFCIKIIYSS